MKQAVSDHEHLGNMCYAAKFVRHMCRHMRSLTGTIRLMTYQAADLTSCDSSTQGDADIVSSVLC
jgi:hypothetical protein